MPPTTSRRRRRALAPAFVVTIATALGGCADETIDPPLGNAGGVGGAAAAGAADGSAGLGASLGGASSQGDGGASGVSAGAAGAGGEGPGGSSGAGGALPKCPKQAPRMNDPCTGEDACLGGGGSLCAAFVARCQDGRWKISEQGANPGNCNPPPPCPDAEPANADLDECGAPQFHGWTHQLCRYPRATCFVYLDCPRIYYGEGIPWRAGRYAGPQPSDACCPASEPAIGDACTEEGILCGWGTPHPGESSSSIGASFARELVCRDGLWAPRLNPLTLCPAELPKESLKCDRGTPCTGYPDPDNDPCKTITATCTDKKWKHSIVPVDGCPQTP